MHDLWCTIVLDGIGYNVPRVTDHTTYLNFTDRIRTALHSVPFVFLFSQTKPKSKPVVVFIKDAMIKKISPNSDTSNSDSGRGHSSEEGDNNATHRTTTTTTESVNNNRDNDDDDDTRSSRRQQSSLTPEVTSTTVSSDVMSPDGSFGVISTRDIRICFILVLRDRDVTDHRRSQVLKYGDTVTYTSNLV